MTGILRITLKGISIYSQFENLMSHNYLKCFVEHHVASNANIKFLGCEKMDSSVNSSSPYDLFTQSQKMYSSVPRA